MAVTTRSTLRPLVRINPSTQDGVEAVKKWGNVFWLRPSSSGSGQAMLIPVHEEVPRIADFIIVPSSDILAPDEVVGYGRQLTKEQGDA